MTEWTYSKLFQLGEDKTEYRKLTSDFVSVIEVDGKRVLKVEDEGLELLSRTAMSDIAHLLRPSHLKQLASILDDPEASGNDRFVAEELLKNANIAAGRVLPSCQDTGTAIIVGKKGQYVWTDGDDGAPLTKGVMRTYTETNLRYSQMAPLSMYKEVNTKNNTPAQIDIYADKGMEYNFLFMAKGGGSANKTYLYQQTPASLREDKMMAFLEEKIKSLGTAACPPYHLAIVIGGLSAEQNLATVKKASARDYDTLPTTGDETGRAFRDVEMEAKIHKLTQNLGIGAQFGGKYFCHDVRVIRLPRHGASLPVGIGVSCSADRQAKAKITEEGIFLEALETDPAKYMPEIDHSKLSDHVIKVDLNRPMKDILAELSQYPIKTRLSLTGTIVVARDLAHARVQKMIEDGAPMPDYFKDHIIYYAGPAKTPEGYASGSFGPTTAGRMDSYVGPFQKLGGSMISLAKGNRSRMVTDACKENGGFYLGSIGGPAAILAKNNIKHVEVLDFEELGMEAVWKIDVEDFPAFIIVDDKGNDFFKDL
ncbi:fumarate hydratase [Kordiimonas marina]|uniref:fumarate hydratase n=1 Tax=Kordiimonas marina TaxID=2872312 RepID=UPI001FF5F61F|nr:fumarate hydratase [Kordiimonas marina]MCJ9427492.1 fumarate hydratase [Kordiimonas marina]